MALSIKTKQVAGVTLLVGVTVVPLSVWYVSTLVRRMLDESRARAELIANTPFQRAADMIAGGASPADGIRTDEGLRSILQAACGYEKTVAYAAVVDPSNAILAHCDPTLAGSTLPGPIPELQAVLSQSVIEQVRALLTPGGKNLEVRLPLLLGTGDRTTEIGSIRVGISTLLLRTELWNSLVQQLAWVGLAMLGALVVSLLLANVIVRPIHVIRSGLARLGRGELDVDVELPRDAELADLGDSFKAVTARLAADRTELAGQRALESVVEHLEDAVALFAPDGTLLFANPAMRAAFAADGTTIGDLLPPGHPYRAVVEETLAGRDDGDPRTVKLPDGGERLVLTHRVAGAAQEPLGVMLLSRNVAYLSQVQSTLSYSRKLAALSRLSAGIAHEVKNPLNATMIRVELLKLQLSDQPEAREHLAIIAAQVRRLDEVVQGFLKFTRPEELTLQPVRVSGLIAAIMPVIKAEADAHHVEIREEFPEGLPDVNADPGLLEQAFLNLALNACQAMPNGGRLRIAGAPAGRNHVEVTFEDTGVGIPPEHLARIFDLYFTTRDGGSGIGLSLVYRTVQLHDGEIEVQSTPGRGTMFRVRLHRA
jgi:signal transduction histidine kinase